MRYNNKDIIPTYKLSRVLYFGKKYNFSYCTNCKKAHLPALMTYSNIDRFNS